VNIKGNRIPVGADQKGPPPQKSKNIWPALAGYIFSKDLDDFM
jgi:hypothetical protein